MPPSKDLIGRQLSTGNATIDAEHVAAFARTLRDDNAAYHGPDASAVPLTCPIAFMTQAMAGGMDTFLELGLDFITLVHGEQEFEYLRPLRLGETLTLRGRIGDIYEKTGSSGTLDFVVLETEAKDVEGQLVFYSATRSPRRGCDMALDAKTVQVGQEL
jgi:hydroxyacyl-ACP dehydratase HTD2-like protein with hotdog domain